MPESWCGRKEKEGKERGREGEREVGEGGRKWEEGGREGGRGRDGGEECKYFSVIILAY